MKKTGFVFLASFLLVLALFAGPDQVPFRIQAIGALALIALFGIPHGAIDHVLFAEGREGSPLLFYGFYLGAMALYAVVWLWWPAGSFTFFLLLSAYHFGQSQFADIRYNRSEISHLLYMSWGSSILSGLLIYHRNELTVWLQSAPDLASVQTPLTWDVTIGVLLISTAATLAALGWLLYKRQLNTERFFMELYFLALIHVCFYVLPLLVGFTLYFTSLHAARVLSEEFGYLKNRRRNFSLLRFIVLLIPYTLLSILGAGILYLLSKQGFLAISDFLLGLILVSTLTLPHSVVMHEFYQKMKSDRMHT